VIRRDLRIFANPNCCQAKTANFYPYTDECRKPNKINGFVKVAPKAPGAENAQVLLR
jgi:hypothetical protein